MQYLLGLIAFGAIGIGVLSLSQATLGVGLIGVGVFLIALARIAQAADHQSQITKLMTRAQQQNVGPTATPYPPVPMAAPPRQTP